MTGELSLEQKKSLIKKQACFSGLNDEEIGALAKLLKEKVFKSGDVVVNEGDSVDSFFLLADGEAQVQKLNYNESTPKLEDVAVLSAKNNAAIGLDEKGFYSLTGLRTASVKAKTDLVTLYMPITLFHGFALFYSHVAEAMRDQARSMTGLRRA